jgi:hypothetical protein
VGKFVSFGIGCPPFPGNSTPVRGSNQIILKVSPDKFFKLIEMVLPSGK